MKKRTRRPRRIKKQWSILLLAPVVIMVLYKITKTDSTSSLNPRGQAKISSSSPDVAGTDESHSRSGSPSTSFPTENSAGGSEQGQFVAGDDEETTLLGNSHLKMPLPTNMQFSQVELAPGIAATYSHDNGTDVGMTIVSHSEFITPTEALLKVKEFSGRPVVPNLTEADPSSFGAGSKIEAVSGSGLDSAVLWKGRNKSGEAVFVGYAPRLDKKGVYIVIMSGPDAYFDDNEGFLENLYNKMQAVPTSP